MSNKDLNILSDKLIRFKRRYLLFELTKGTLLFVAVVILLLLSVNYLEYRMYLSSAWRKSLFIGSISFGSLVFIRFVGLRLLQILGIYNVLDSFKISALISNYFPQLGDRLINVLELGTRLDGNYSLSLRDAAISQKVEQLKVVDFNSAVGIKNLYSVLKYFAASVLLTAVVLLFNSESFVASGIRLVHYNEHFERPAPFTFTWSNYVEGVTKGSDFELEVLCEGNEIPSLLYVNIGGNNFLMSAKGNGRFTYSLNAVVNTIPFFLTDLQFRSQAFTLNVVPVPVLHQFQVGVVPPAYTFLEPYWVENVNDITVPMGSTLDLVFSAFDTDTLQLISLADKVVLASPVNSNDFRHSMQILESSNYSVELKNEHSVFQPFIRLTVDVTEDLFPEMELAQTVDSMQLSRYFFKGRINDDYGFTQLAFHLQYGSTDSIILLPFHRFVRPQEFYFSINFSEFNPDRTPIQYFFSVADNDAITGAKTTFSNRHTFVFPNRSDLNEAEILAFQKIEDLIEESHMLARELKEDVRNLQMRNLNSTLTDWERSQMAEEMLQKRNALEEVLGEIENTYHQLTNFQNSFTQQRSDILEKQQLIKELLDSVITDEIKALLDEFNELAKSFNEQKLNELGQQMDLSFESLSRQLDRNLEMLKRMRLEQNVQGIIDELQTVGELHETLSDKVNPRNESDDLFKDIAEQAFQFEQLKQEFMQLLEENNKLIRPYGLDSFKEIFDRIEELLKENKTIDGASNKNDVKHRTRNAGEQMKRLAADMQSLMDSSSMQQRGEDVANLQQILRNLIRFSFEQERVLTTMVSLPSRDPIFIDLTRNQRNLINQSVVIQDSLYALANRVPQINNVVSNELLSLSTNVNRALAVLSDDNYAQSMVHQQLVFTAANNLSLLLSEILDNIENQNNREGEGEGDGNSGRQGMNMLQQQSENLKEQLQRMLEQMKDGGQPMSRELSETLMMQEMMQQMLRELINSGGVGEDSRRQLQEIDRLLELSRQDILQRQISPDLINRQGEILSRLLEAERSERERDEENKRESNTAEDLFYSNPAIFFERNENEEIMLEELQRNGLKVNSFYLMKLNRFIERWPDN